MLFFVGALIFSGFSFTEKTILTQINEEASELAGFYTKKFDILFDNSKNAADSISAAISSMNVISGKEVKRLIVKTLKNHPEVYGSTVSFSADATPLKEFAPYYCWKKKELTYMSLTDAPYKYQEQDWFTVPLKEGKGSWGKPYFDNGAGDILMVTYSSPIRHNGALIGVATADISLENLVERIRNLKVGKTGYAFIVTKASHFIALPSIVSTKGKFVKPSGGGSKILSDDTIKTMIQKTKSEDLKRLSKLIDSPDDESAKIRDPFTGVESLVITKKFDSNSDTMVIIYPRQEILKPLISLKFKVVIISAIVICLIMVIILFLSSTLTSPIRRLVEQADHFSNGNFDMKLPDDNGPGEIRQLSKVFNKLGTSILEYIENIKKTTTDKERYHQELMIAADIQQGILPQKFPPFDDLQKQIDLFGMALPAREVGGDYYDFFRLSKSRIGIVIADVSDKGAASALFMSMTRVLIREVALLGSTPSEVLRRTNHVLAKDNPSSMFVTLLYGDYDIAADKISFSCAGHNPPLRVSASGEITELPVKVRLPLGAMPGTRYVTTDFSFKSGEKILLYTDGLTEANNSDGEMFGIERVKDVIRQTSGSSEEITKKLLASVTDFQAGAPQYDDITMLMLKNTQSDDNRITLREDFSKTMTLELPAVLSVLGRISEFVEGVALEMGFKAKEAKRIFLAVDEVVTNVIMHSYQDNDREKFLMKVIPMSDRLVIVIIDHGKPFDFKEKSRVYTGKADPGQPEGGIGLFLARKSVDEIEYIPDTVDGNRVTIVKYLKGSR